MGKDEGWIAERCLRERLPLPPRIENAPQLFDGLELYWWAYQDLSTCRPAGFGGAYPIPWTAIIDYARHYDFDEAQTEALVSHVRTMDEAFMKWYDQRYGSGNKQQRSGISAKNAPNRLQLGA
jgi:hypothetical protein